MVTDFVEALSDLTYYGSGAYYFEVDPDNNTLAVGDKIQGQTFTGNNVRSYQYTVHSISSGNEYVRVSGPPSTDETKGYDFRTRRERLGHLQTGIVIYDLVAHELPVPRGTRRDDHAHNRLKSP